MGYEAKLGMFKDLTKVEFTNLEKIMYPELRITKAQVIEYYVRMAPKMLELLVNRPLVMTRYPNGIDKEGFYEKDAPAGTPSWVETFRRFAETSQREISYVVCNSLDTLIWLANLAALEIHMILSRIDLFETPDLVLFDVDPKPPSGFDEAASVALYIAKRDFAVTPEPMGVEKKGEGMIFVVQEHHARQLHYDFRLEREGVLKSWAVPKGVPESGGEKRLAVETEDHPLDYASFEGTIPQGQYGAGTVEIWDKGGYELKVWERDKIEFMLNGQRLHGRYVLARFKKAGEKQWVLLKTKDSL